MLTGAGFLSGLGLQGTSLHLDAIDIFDAVGGG